MQEEKERYRYTINETDGLSHNVCMRCIGTLEFIDDFHQNCHMTQQRLIEAKKLKKCPKIKENSASDLENEVEESDKENATPNIPAGTKRKRKPTSHEKTKLHKPMPLGTKRSFGNGNQETSSRILTEKNIEVKSSPSGTKSKSEASSYSDQEASDSRTRVAAGTRNSLALKKSQKEPKTDLDSPKSKPVPVIVKIEKQEALESSFATGNAEQIKSNTNVWTPRAAMLPEGDKPKSKREEKEHDRCPTAGDEAEEGLEKTPEPSSTGDSNENGEEVREEKASMEVVRKSVIEKTSQAVKKDEVGVESPRRNQPRAASTPSRKQEEKEEEDAESTSEEEEEEEVEEGKEKSNKFGRISDLISKEQKDTIETLYTLDMSVVDEKIVTEKLLFLDKKTFGCKICEASYPRQDKCQVHIWGHLEMKPYRCNACSFATVTVSNIRCHIRKSHLKIKPYVCEFCEKRYVTAFLLEEHLNTHTGSRPYRCNVCEFTSASRQVLSYHIATHKPVKDITCDVCGKEFYSKARMRAHMVIHNKDKAANMCKLCSIYLCNSEALQRHYSNVHSQEYVCNVCDKRCKSRKALNNHQNVHSAAKYKCNVCSNVYKSSHILKEHLLKHKGIRKYKCSVCEKDFAQQSHLAAHMAVHSERRFFCPGCKRAFNRHDNMKMHTKRCEPFLANPELKDLLKIRRSRSKTSEITTSSVNPENSPTDPKATPKSGKDSESPSVPPPKPEVQRD